MGRGINPCYPTGIFRIWGSQMSQNRSTGFLARNIGICSAHPTFHRNRNEFRLFCYMRLNRLGQEQRRAIDTLDAYIKLSSRPRSIPAGVLLATICQNYIV